MTAPTAARLRRRRGASTMSHRRRLSCVASGLARVVREQFGQHAMQGTRYVPQRRIDARRRAIRERAGREVVHDHAKAVQVRRRPDRIATRLFRRHARRRAEQAVALGVGAVAGGTEIHQDDAAARILAHDVAGLDVAVDQSRGVHRTERRRKRAGDGQDFGDRPRPVPPDPIRQRLPGDQVRPQARAPVVDRGAMHGEDVLVAHAREPACLGDEHARMQGVVAAQLERNLALEQRIEGTMDLAMTALADRFEDPQVSPGHATVPSPGRRADGERLDDFRDAPQARESGRVRTEALFQQGPVDALAVDQCRQVLTHALRHGPSPERVSRLPCACSTSRPHGARACARHSPTVGPSPRRFPRN